MIRQFKITRAAELPTLAIFRDFIEKACRPVSVPDDLVFQLKLAVDEACANVIEHGYKGMDPGSIILALKFEADRIVVTITDFGHPFEPSEPPRPDLTAGLEDRPTGGLGLYFIYQTMDEIDYQSDELGNRLIFVKQLPAGAD